MAVIARDTFTGAADTDIAGRTPDGGGTPALAIGTWNKVDDSPGTGTFDIVFNPFLGVDRGVAGNNVASFDVPLPEAIPNGELMGIVVFSRNGVNRSADLPSGWSEANRLQDAAGAQLAFFLRVKDGSEGADVTVGFTGGGAANTTQVAFALAIAGADASPVGVIGSDSFNLSNDNIGPISGITPGQNGSLVLVIAGKTNDFNGHAAATGFQHGRTLDSGLGDDAGVCMLWQLQTTATATGSVTVSDNGAVASTGIGVGFLIEIKLATQPVGTLRHRGTATVGDWNHYVVKDIPGMGGPSLTNQSSEATFNIYGPVPEANFAAVLCRHMDPEESGYEWNAVIIGGGELFLELYHIWEGFFTVLRTVGTYSAVDWRTTPVTLRLCVSGSAFDVEIEAYVNGVRIIPDDGTLDPLGTFIHNPPSGEELLAGEPGMCMHDITPGGTGMALSCSQWQAATECDFTDVPCEGGPDNPYPWDPPPPTPLPDVYIYIRKNLAWRQVLVEEVLPRKNLQARTLQMLGIRKNLQWRFPHIYPDTEVEQEPDTPDPPYHDPCYVTVPPPIGDVTPIPLTSRFYGMSNMPMGMLSSGSLFTGTQKALYNGYPNDLDFALANGATLVGAQGGGSGIKVGGDTWDLDFFLDGTRAKLDPLYADLLTGTANGSFFGYSMADDVTSANLWKPSGIPMAELATAVATIHAEYPGIRLGSRMRPTQAGFNLGLDFYTVQYTSERGDAAEFIEPEYALAISWNAFLIISLNYIHGGDGSSGVQFPNGTEKGQSSHNWACSPTEVATYLPAMYAECESQDGTAEHVAGSLGYQYHAQFLEIPGIMDGMALARNALAALPALP